MQRILITGANGLLGQKLVALSNEIPDIDLIATAKGLNRNPENQYDYVELDITQKEEVAKVFEEYRPDVVINTAAMTHVDQCELNPESCWLLNVDAVQNQIEACTKIDSFFLQLSTDFVFDGSSGPYQEGDPTNPISKYAESKLESEQLLEASNLHYAIVRTMLVYGIVHDMSRSNIVLWVKRSLEEGKEIQVVNDQWRTPTLAEDLAKACLSIAREKKEGIFHISGKDLLTPYDMAIATADFFGLDKSLIKEVDGSIFSQPAKRPPRTGFILDKARKELGYAPLSFKEGLAVLKSQMQNV